jgi:hypothetical protein
MSKSIVADFFKSKWSEENINAKLEEALTLLMEHKGVSKANANKLRKEAKELLKL